MAQKSRFEGQYNYTELVNHTPALKHLLIKNMKGEATIDYSNPESVYLLNKSLLESHYGIKGWVLPPNYLVPPIPGRADYIYAIADLLKSEANKKIDHSKIKGIDIGCGSSIIYPIIGASEYGWTMIGTDIDKKGLKNGQNIINANPDLQSKIELRHQQNSKLILNSVLNQEDGLDFAMCNPPFYSSVEEAVKINQRKSKNLKSKKKTRNFGGQIHELVYNGGEKAFVSQYIKESHEFPKAVLWYTSLISKGEHLKLFKKLLEHKDIKDYEIIDIARGNKITRVIAWSFFTKRLRKSWMEYKTI